MLNLHKHIFNQGWSDKIAKNNNNKKVKYLIVVAFKEANFWVIDRSRLHFKILDMNS